MVARSQASETLIEAGDVALPALLRLPADARALVIFVHGSGSSRHSSRNQFVAEVLERGYLATLLFDLLSAREDVIDRRTAALRFDIELLAGRLLAVTDWCAASVQLRHLPFGYFGASTGAAAALVAASRRPTAIKAIVCRGGRPDMADRALQSVVAPTLLIVGSQDSDVLRLNRQAAAQLRAHTELAVVAGATHLFEEPGTLENVAALASNWFTRHCLAVAPGV